MSRRRKVVLVASYYFPATSATILPLIAAALIRGIERNAGDRLDLKRLAELVGLDFGPLRYAVACTPVVLLHFCPVSWRNSRSPHRPVVCKPVGSSVTSFETGSFFIAT